ncbi:ATP-binding protein [Psychroserpens sp.]|uniref:ATP-binding response regulator n=1 Tax=Psychroserpens sp. TaxID=2020870 RepID=UPI003C75A4AE
MAAQESKRLQELDNLKSRFITNITHEFRTPLTLVLGYINTLKEKLSRDKTLQQPIDAIEHNSNNLLSLVNDMLDLARLEKGKLQLNLTNSDMVSFTRYMTKCFLSHANQKNIDLEFSAQVESLHMDFDVEKMRQILSNLISNAIKFSKNDTVVRVTLTTESSQVIIKTIDQGVGISVSDIPFIFDRFYQTEKSSKLIGSGIGLALTRELVGLMEGQISVESTLQKGSKFTVTLPITTKAIETHLELSEPNTSSQFELKPNLIKTQHQDDLNTILIVEDNTEVANYIASCVNNSYNVIFALDGEAGLVLAKETIPDIIITDVMMPKMDGNILTEQLQNNIATNHIPIIMLTAKALQSDKLTGIKSGADVYLTKPFQKEELMLRLEKLISKRKQLQNHYNVGRIVKIASAKIKKDKTLEFLNTAIKHIHSNIENPEYNAKKLASDLNMSDSQLYRKLKAITNKSSAIFIRSVRLEKAKELIETTDLSISEIAYSTGFNDPNWFSKAFKADFNQSPSEIRN